MKFFSNYMMDFPNDYFPSGRMPKVNLSCKPKNKLGYRGRDFEDCGDVNILFLGDEWTLGENIEESALYSSLICEKLSDQSSLKVHGFNLAHPDKGYDYISRILWNALRTMDPDFVFICFPDMGRREYFALNGKCIDFSPMRAAGAANQEIKVNRIERELLRDMHALYTKFDEPINALRNFVLIEALLLDHNIPWGYSVNGCQEASEHLDLMQKKQWFGLDQFVGFSFDEVEQESSEGGIPGNLAHEKFSNQLFTWICDNQATIYKK